PPRGTLNQSRRNLFGRPLMPSPFPGMDPYLEDPPFWSAFHASFITYWRNALNDCLPDHYEARIDEKVHLVEVAPTRRELVEPGVVITRHKPPRVASLAPARVATLDACPPR